MSTMHIGSDYDVDGQRRWDTTAEDDVLAANERCLERILSEHPDIDACESAGGLRLWVYEGLPPGGFMSALLRNDLTKAFRKADSTNHALMSSWAKVMDQIPDSLKNVDDLVE